MMSDVAAALLAAEYIRVGRNADALEVLEVWFGGTSDNVPDDARAEIEAFVRAA